jgi:hypothetical protein
MRKRLMALTLLCTFVFALCFAFAASMQEAEAGPCQNCYAYCICKDDIYGGVWNVVGQFCDLHYCDYCYTPPCR